MSKQLKSIKSSGNVFADLGLPDPEQRLLKSDLAIEITEAIASRGLKQKEAARLLGVDQAQISKIKCGRLSEFSIERLVRYLASLNKRVDLLVRDAEEPVRRPAKHRPAHCPEKKVMHAR